MHEFKAVKVISQPLHVLFDIVRDIEKYPEFVPWCLEAKVLTEEGNEMTAQLKVGTSFISESYTSNITLTPLKRIESTCHSGPLKSLKNTWEFQDLDGKTEVTLVCSFELSSFILNVMMSKFVQDIGSKMIAAFEKRAHAYGEK